MIDEVAEAVGDVAGAVLHQAGGFGGEPAPDSA